jgi:phage host-nuclease inhibitor protein Gam
MPRARLVLPFFALGFLVALAPARADSLNAQRTALYARYAAQLAELSDWCQERQVAEAAEQLKAWLPSREADQLTLFVLPSTVAAPAKISTDEPEWRIKWLALRAEQADALVALAKRAAAERHPSLAFELVTEAVRENPEQAEGRRILGYARFRDAWHTAFEIRQLNANKVWHETFGWLPKTYVERYEKGQRYYQGRWVSTDEEARLRSDIARGWRVESEHYVVTTNHSLEEGVRLSRRLEMLFAVWQQVFLPYEAGEADLAKRFAGRAPRHEPKQHNVTYYRTRQEYQDALRATQPQLDMSLGVYFDSTRTAYFFAGADQEPGTLYHEATHQLFHETRKVAPAVAHDQNFWIVEGIACYMESLDEHPGYCTLGGPNAGRMPAARHRLLEDKFYVPLAELVKLNMESLQRDPRIAPLYSQSAGVADFLMHDAEGRYRDALVRYLEAIYTGHDTVPTLADLCGVSYPTLDEQYRAFMTPSEATPTVEKTNSATEVTEGTEKNKKAT